MITLIKETLMRIQPTLSEMNFSNKNRYTLSYFWRYLYKNILREILKKLIRVRSRTQAVLLDSLLISWSSILNTSFASVHLYNLIWWLPEVTVIGLFATRYKNSFDERLYRRLHIYFPMVRSFSFETVID